MSDRTAKRPVSIGKRPLSPAHAAPLAAMFDALSDPVRLRLFDIIRRAGQSGICSCDLVEPVGRSQPTVSHHLKVLREVGLVSSRRDGTWQWYSTTPEATEKVVQFLS